MSENKKTGGLPSKKFGKKSGKNRDVVLPKKPDVKVLVKPTGK